MLEHGISDTFLLSEYLLLAHFGFLPVSVSHFLYLLHRPMGAYLGSVYCTPKIARLTNPARPMLLCVSGSECPCFQFPLNWTAKASELGPFKSVGNALPSETVLPFCPLIRILQLSFFIPNCGYLELESFVPICHCHRSGQIWLSFWSLWVISFQTLTSHRHLLLLTSKPALYHGSSLAWWQNYRLQMTYMLSLLCSIKSWSSLLLLLLKIRLNLLLSQAAGSMLAHNFSGIVSISLLFACPTSLPYPLRHYWTVPQRQADALPRVPVSSPKLCGRARFLPVVSLCPYSADLLPLLCSGRQPSCGRTGTTSL